MATLSTAARKRLPSYDFAIPPRNGKPGAYPIEDESHARNALARVAQHGTAAEKAEVRRAVHRKYPNIGKGDDKKPKKSAAEHLFPKHPHKGR